MDLAGQDEPNREDGESFDCPVDRDNCSGDGGINPIHNFMSYTQVSIAAEIYSHDFNFHDSVLISSFNIMRASFVSIFRTTAWMNSPQAKR